MRAGLPHAGVRAVGANSYRECRDVARLARPIVECRSDDRGLEKIVVRLAGGASSTGVSGPNVCARICMRAAPLQINGRSVLRCSSV
jgi:hypothetical protein